MSAAAFTACSTVVAISEGMTGWRSFFIVSRKSLRSSALSMASAEVPRSRTPAFSR